MRHSRVDPINLGASRLGWYAVVTLMALVTLIADTWLATLVGIIRDGLPYDGVGYVVESRSLYLLVQHDGLGSFSRDAIHMVRGGALSLSPGWKMVMFAHLKLIGDGLWQVYTVRFWQLLLLMLTTFWLGRRHGGNEFGLFMAAAAVFLPTVSPNAIATLRQSVYGSYDTLSVYIADLRPDGLYSMLLVVAVLLLIETAQEPTARIMAVDGTLAGAAVLVKSSTAPLTGGIWLLVLVYFGLRQRNSRRSLVRLYLWAGGCFLMVVSPWALTGGFHATLEYLKRWAFGESTKFLYGLPNEDLVANLGYYWDLFRVHMGFGTVLALPIMLALCLIWPKLLASTVTWSHVLAYSALAFILYAIPTVEVAKNYFLALPAYLVVWFLIILLAAGVWTRLSWEKLIIAAVATVLAVVMLMATSIYSVAVLPAAEGARHNLGVVRKIANDLREVLTNEDKYLTYWSGAFPGAIELFLLDEQGKRPVELVSSIDLFDLQRDPGGSVRIISTILRPAKAILMFREPLDVAERAVYVPRGGATLLQLIRRYLTDPSSGLCAYREYHFVRLTGYDVHGGLTAVLYVSCHMLHRDEVPQRVQMKIGRSWQPRSENARKNEVARCLAWV